MEWTQTLTMIGAILVATVLIITVVKIGSSTTNMRFDSIDSQLAEMRKDICLLLEKIIPQDDKP